eukprot:jgi/Mesen1/134/ME1128765C07643
MVATAAGRLQAQAAERRGEAERPPGNGQSGSCTHSHDCQVEGSRDACGGTSGLRVGRTLRDAALSQQCGELRERYMAPFRAKMADAHHSFARARLQVEEAQEATAAAEGGTLWWLEALALAERSSSGSEALGERLRSGLLETDHL